MKTITYQNKLINKKQLRELLSWSFSNYDSMQACALADELKYLGFKYASQAGISISLEDLRIPFIKNSMVEKANNEILDLEKIYLKGKITDIERFQKIIDIWGSISDSLKEQVVFYFKNYDPLNSVYIMAFSGARGNLAQVRQLVGMRGLMAGPSGEVMNIAIEKNFREGLTITDYLISGYGARKGIIDTALKTANSGYLTRRLIDVGQDILIRDKDCSTIHSLLFSNNSIQLANLNLIYEKLNGRVLNKSIFNSNKKEIIANKNSEITLKLIEKCLKKNIKRFYIRSPLTCNLYRAICQRCYGWDLANENLVEMGEAIGILAGQSIGEPGTQLTMRTFHTGGVFNSQAKQKILSPMSGIVKFTGNLRTVRLRTNIGEDVLVAKSSGYFFIVPITKNQKLTRIQVLENTILFLNNNDYVLERKPIGEVINKNKQSRIELKPILTDNSGEIFMPLLRNRGKLLSNNKLIWILSGQLYKSPLNSFVNFYSDYKLNANSYIFRTKILNSYKGYVKVINQENDLYRRKIEILTNKYLLTNFNLQSLPDSFNSKNYKNCILEYQNLKYLIKTKIINSKYYIRLKKSKIIGDLLTNAFKTNTGGKLYYDKVNQTQVQNKLQNSLIKYLHVAYLFRNNWTNPPEQSQKLLFHKKNKSRLNSKIRNSTKFRVKLQLHEKSAWKPTETDKSKFLNSPLKLINWESPPKQMNFRTILWIEEETHKFESKVNNVLVKPGNYIAKNFQLLNDPKIFSKISGLVNITKKNNDFQILSIKPGSVYKGKIFKNLFKKIYYPGETIFSNIIINNLSFCQNTIIANNKQLLIQPIKLYEIPYSIFNRHNKENQNSQNVFKLVQNYIYESNTIIKTSKSLDLIITKLNFNSNQFFYNNTIIELFKNKEMNSITCKTYEKFFLTKYIVSSLKYRNIKSCFLISSNQFIDSYTILGYLESVTLNSSKIVKYKMKTGDIKEILLISNKDCFAFKKSKASNKKIGNFILESENINKVGKIIGENRNFFIIQKAQAYFFPNCKLDEIDLKSPIKYKTMTQTQFQFQTRIKTNRSISLNFINLFRASIKNRVRTNIFKLSNYKIPLKIEFSKFFFEKNSRLYNSLIPNFLKQFSLNNTKMDLNIEQIIEPKEFEFLITRDNLLKETEILIQKSKIKSRNILIRSSEFIKDLKKKNNTDNFSLTLVKFCEYPFTKSIKSVGLYSLTADHFEQETNNIFCQNNMFIESGKTVGFLNLEKEITIDIVQGLPKIEQVLEARKQILNKKKMPRNKKKGTLIQKTNLDPNLKFKKLGSLIQENDKINPHKLLKVYFNYYGIIKIFTCDRKKKIKYARLIRNYESSYKSFKKVQLFILNSVQSIYKSQGVLINDKHLEIVIKQMTTRVIVTYEGMTPLLKGEIIDLYHMKYINQIISTKEAKSACYAPLLFGITKAALNNPSFISAASFQETIRVLTKASIEGKIDWLRGLKENIVIGYLIPAGTGFKTYRNSFKKPRQLA
uniref:DNA-directed RNA polymerase n=1 Tax=Climaconeis cf. scalaris TaxID=2846828 RepID=A0A8F8SR99_9STRA|nr:RNA polymerase beta'' subunit [Climaconeis cf. scalaris]